MHPRNPTQRERLAARWNFRPWRVVLRLAICAGFLAPLCCLRAAESPLPTDKVEAADAAVSREALGKLAGLIGGWRGVGQPNRGSTKGAWQEQGEWVWNLKGKSPALEYTVRDGKQLKSARLTYEPINRQYVLAAQLPDGVERTYHGTLKEDRLTLTSDPDATGDVFQLTVHLLNEKRTVLLFGRKRPQQERFASIAQVGYTRQGTTLAVEGADGPQCIVTGGKANSSMVYKGKTYYFCCTGCRDAFVAEPDKIIAEAAAREAAKK